jgi:hypothetical protein
VLVEILDYQDVLVLGFPATGAGSRAVSDKLVEECRDAVSFFRPSAGVVMDLTHTATMNNFLIATVVHLVGIGTKLGYKVASAGMKNEVEAMLTQIKFLPNTAGCYDSVVEAVGALRTPTKPAA